MRIDNRFLPCWVCIFNKRKRRNDRNWVFFCLKIWWLNFLGLVLQVFFVFNKYHHCIWKPCRKNICGYLYYLLGINDFDNLPSGLFVDHRRWLAKINWIPWCCRGRLYSYARRYCRLSRNNNSWTKIKYFW